MTEFAVQHIRLPNGKRAFLRSLKPSDRDTVAELFQGLSPEAKRSRFLRSIDSLSPAMLNNLLNVDGVNHVALVLFVEESHGYEPVGIARIARYEDNFHAADIAVTVRDAWHGQGMGTVLAKAIVAARPVGVDELVTGLLRDNVASFRLLSKFGPVRAEFEAPGVMTARVKLV